MKSIEWYEFDLQEHFKFDEMGKCEDEHWKKHGVLWKEKQRIHSNILCMTGGGEDFKKHMEITTSGFEGNEREARKQRNT